MYNYEKLFTDQILSSCFVLRAIIYVAIGLVFDIKMTPHNDIAIKVIGITFKNIITILVFYLKYFNLVFKIFSVMVFDFVTIILRIITQI